MSSLLTEYFTQPYITGYMHNNLCVHFNFRPIIHSPCGVAWKRVAREKTVGILNRFMQLIALSLTLSRGEVSLCFLFLLEQVKVMEVIKQISSIVTSRCENFAAAILFNFFQMSVSRRQLLEERKKKSFSYISL